jgi:hypothetical protein
MSYRPTPLTEMKGNEIEARGLGKLNAATLRRVEDRKETGFLRPHPGGHRAVIRAA